MPELGYGSTGRQVLPVQMTPGGLPSLDISRDPTRAGTPEMSHVSSANGERGSSLRALTLVGEPRPRFFRLQRRGV